MAVKPEENDLRARIKALEQEVAGHHNIEKLLWERQDQFFKVLDSLEAIVYVADMHSYEVLFANRYAQKIFGPLIGKTCWQVMQAGMTGPCNFCNNWKLLTPDGRPGETILWEMQNTCNNNWYSIRDKAIEWFDGRVVHLQIAVEISAWKKAEAALQASEEKFRTVADFTYDWEYWINERGLLNYISPSCERITGYSPREFEENPALLHELIHPDDRQYFKTHLEDELATSGVYHLNFRIIDRQGKERWISHYCQEVFGHDNKFLGRRASNRDISLQKRAQDKIRLNERRQAALLKLYEMQTLPVKEVCDFVLEASLPLTGSEIGFMGFLNDDESEMTIHAWSKTVMEQCKTHEKPIVFSVKEAGIWGEAVRKRCPVIVNDFKTSPLKKGIPDGHVSMSRFMAVPLFDKEKIVAVSAVGNKCEDYIEQDIKQLQLLIKGMWQIIKRIKAEEDLIKQSEMIKHFANTVSHDLKNPAVAIHGLAGVLRRKRGDIPRDRMEKILEQILKSAEQIVSLADNINAYISSREKPLHITTLDLKQIWQAICDEFTPRFKKRNISWVVPEAGIPEIRADRSELLRAYRNLVDNALKYGGGVLSMISMGYTATDTHHILSVQNNGELIPQEAIESIFEIFSRRAAESAPAGTGLGLAIVREMARDHRGESWVKSDTENHTTFYISIARNL